MQSLHCKLNDLIASIFIVLQEGSVSNLETLSIFLSIRTCWSSILIKDFLVHQRNPLIGYLLERAPERRFCNANFFLIVRPSQLELFFESTAFSILHCKTTWKFSLSQPNQILLLMPLNWLSRSLNQIPLCRPILLTLSIFSKFQIETVWKRLVSLLI